MNGTDRRMYTPLSVGMSVAMVIVLLATCGGGAPSDPLVAKISGYVTEAGTGKALAGVSIQTDPATSSPTTDETGWYQINRPDAGSYTVKATLMGYNTATKSVQVGAGAHVPADLQMVKIVAVASVAISSGPSLLGVGSTLVLTATPRDASGNALAGRAIDWTTTSAGVVSIFGTSGASVTVTGVSSGTSTIRASCEGVGGSVDITVPAPASVALSNGPAALPLGQTLAITATVRDGAGNVLTGRAIQWTTNNPGAVSLSPTTGATVTLTGVASGTATIRATCEGVSGSVNITVPVPATVTLSSGPATVIAGQTLTISATVRDSTGNTLAGRAMQWTTSSGAVVSLSATAGASVTLTALAAGTSTIRVVCENASASIVITVPPPAPVAAITVTVAQTALVVGDSVQFTAVPRDSAGQPLANRQVTWTTSNASVASIRGTGATAWSLAVAAGTTAVTATSETVQKSTTVTVVEAGTASTVTITPPPTLVVADSTQLVARATNSSGHLVVRPLAWVSDNTAVATVTAAGLVRAIAAGNSQVHATADGVSGTATIAVVNPVPVITSTSPDTVSVGAGTTIVVINGRNFQRSSTGTVGGVAKTTTYQDATKLQITLAASELTVPGTIPITVTTPTPGGGTSNGVNLAVTLPSGRMASGENLTVTIATPGDVATRTFDAVQGASIIVSAGKGVGTATLGPWVRLASPTGSILAQSYDDAVAQIATTAPTTGRYTVLIASQNSQGSNSGTGTLTLTLANLPGAFVVPAGDEGGPMTNGTTHTGTITRGDIDLWSFAAVKGATIVVSAGKTDGTATLNPRLRVVSPSGVVLGDDKYNTTAAQVAATATEDGTYIAILSSQDVSTGAWSGTGPYTIEVANSSSPLVVASGDDGGPMTNGVTHTGTIAPGDIDPWSFRALKGATIVVSAGKTDRNANLNPRLRLVSPSGVVLGDDKYNTTAAQVAATATEDGTYIAILSSQDVSTGAWSGTGPYTIEVAISSSTLVVASGDDGGPMTTGGSYTGAIATGDIDQWTFSAARGSTIVVSVGKTDGTTTLNPRLRLVSPSGVVLGDDKYNTTTSQVTATATEDGKYIAILSSQDVSTGAWSGTGPYKITLANPPAAFVVPSGDDGGAMASGVNYAGTISLADLDQWSFTATAGATIILSLSKDDGTATLNPWLRLVAPNGSIQRSDYALQSVQLTTTAQTAGTYTVLVGSKSINTGAYDGTGAYHIKLTRVP